MTRAASPAQQPTITLDPGTCPECGRLRIVADINVSYREPGKVEFIFDCPRYHLADASKSVTIVEVAREVVT